MSINVMTSEWMNEWTSERHDATMSADTLMNG